MKHIWPTNKITPGVDNLMSDQFVGKLVNVEIINEILTVKIYFRIQTKENVENLN